MNMICPVCGSEYLGWVTRCADCGVAVVLPTEAPNPLDLPEEEQVVYELGAWSLDLQASAAAAMAEAGIPHAFDGADLVVHVDHEAAVDALLEAVEHGPDGDGSASGQPSTLVYELDQWDVAARDELCERLDAGGVPYRWEGDQLVVDPADEEAVDFLVAEVRGEATDVPAEAFADTIARSSPPDAQHDDDGDERDGDERDGDEDGEDDGDDKEHDARPPVVATTDEDEDPEVLGRIYLTAASLADDPADPEALVELLDFSDTLDEDRPPFGVDRGFWEQVLVVVDDLADTIAGPDLDDEDDEDDEDDDANGGDDEQDDEPDDEQRDGGAIEASGPARGQFIPQRVERTAAEPAGGVPEMNEAQARRLARQLRSMLQPYV